MAPSTWKCCGPFASGLATYVAIRRDDEPTVVIPAGAPLDPSRFSHVVLDLFLDATNGSVKLTVDGAVRVDKVGIGTDHTATGTDRTFWAGAYAYDSPACAVRIDDVVLDTLK